MKYIIPYSQFLATQDSEDVKECTSLDIAKAFINSSGEPGVTYIIKQQSDSGPLSTISYQVHPLRDEKPPRTTPPRAGYDKAKIVMGDKLPVIPSNPKNPPVGY